MTAFAYVLDTCRMNASTVIALNQSIEPRNTNSFDFGMTLVLQVVRPFVALRSKSGLSKSIPDKIQITLSKPRKESYNSSQLCAFPVQFTKQPGMWKRKRKLEAETVEAVLFLWKRKRKREKPTASAST